jgi:putative membrane protein
VIRPSFGTAGSAKGCSHSDNFSQALDQKDHAQTTKRFLLAAAATLALAACNNAADDTATDATVSADAAATGATVNPDTAADASMPVDAQGFADKASGSDMYEIEAGKLAQSMGKSQAVKDFGAMMVKDHTKSTNDLKTAATSAQGVTVAPKLDAKQQSDLDALKAAGDNFDAIYKQQQVAAHEAALAMLQSYAQSGDNAALKEFAAKTTPVAKGHLDQARNMP